MIVYRQRGLANVYGFVSTVVAVGFLPLYREILPSLTYVTLDQVDLLPYVVAVFLGMVASVGLLHDRASNLHRIEYWGAFVLALRQVMVVGAFIFAFMFITKDQGVSRVFLGSYLMILTGVLTMMHARMPRMLADFLFPDSAQMPTLFVGRTGNLEALDAWITNRGHLGMTPVGLLSDTPPTRAEKAVAPYLGKVDQLEKVLHERRVGQVILLEWIDDTEVVEKMIGLCESEGCRFLIHNNYGAKFARTFIPLEEGGHHFLALQHEPLEDPINRSLKRLLDIAISLPIVLFVVPPLCVWVWLMQKRQAPGPLFFVNPRGGQNRTHFNMLKFRSMYAIDHDINKQATMGDSRIYPFGAFLRKSSLDEFPQFINVLVGNMSIVGPRPHLPKHDDEFSQIARSYRIRSLVKPGITGLAQVRGYRGEITDPEKLHRRVYWDLYYVTNWSLALDLRIVFLTAWHVVRPPKTAY
ncbi:exopolysaccharide biosynthesis polyprenyl glycosylphosphotransferase [Opitutaceae bacterium TAV4]|nr:exopolysaccharide biosynthesis polyprenyl glycosylphosphotransferase [Opitutaceae bacterium TAV4]RRJ98548.1 exopolysaccharide biosynthesis polyprenyl glycosylphosphotransferase [Opitutaceae bacterium TAV3]